MGRIMYVYRAGDLVSTIIGNVLRHHFPGKVVLVAERPPSPLDSARAKIRRYGFFRGMDQIMFILFSKAFLGRKRVLERVVEEEGLSGFCVPLVPELEIESVRDERAMHALCSFESIRVLVINGTRIWPRRLLDALGCPILNIHLGMMPWYRGVHGGYWALVQGDRERFGATLYFVNEKIDAGGIIARRRGAPRKRDTIATYPIRQVSVMLEPLIETVASIVGGKNVEAFQAEEEGALYTHPGISQYFMNWARLGVR